MGCEIHHVDSLGHPRAVFDLHASLDRASTHRVPAREQVLARQSGEDAEIGANFFPRFLSGTLVSRYFNAISVKAKP